MKMEHMEDQSVRAFRSRVRSHVLVNDQRLGCPLVNGSTVAKHRSTLDASCRTVFYSLRQHIVCLNTRRVASEQSAWVAYEEEGASAKAVIADGV